MRNVTEIQRRLISLGYLAKGGDDGIFGDKSLDAYNHFLASKGKPPHVGMILLAELNRDLFPEEQPVPAAPKPNPLQDWLIGLAIKQLAPKLKGLPMLSGYKTYATCAVLAVMGVYALIFGDLPIVGHVDPGSAIMELLSTLGLGFARSGAKADVKKLGE